MLAGAQPSIREYLTGLKFGVMMSRMSQPHVTHYLQKECDPIHVLFNAGTFCTLWSVAAKSNRFFLRILLPLLEKVLTRFFCVIKSR
jgi:hypothetical protein